MHSHSNLANGYGLYVRLHRFVCMALSRLLVLKCVRVLRHCALSQRECNSVTLADCVIADTVRGAYVRMTRYAIAVSHALYSIGALFR